MSGSSYDDEIQVALTANAAQLEEGVAQATASINGMQSTVAQEAAAFNAAVQSKIEAMVQLNAAFADTIANTEGIATAEAALDQAMSAGAITAEEYAGYVAQLDGAEASLVAAAEAATAAVAEQTAALSISGGVAREVGVMIGELARGNYTRLEGSTITLANRTGVLSTALNALLSPAGMVAIAVAGVAYEVFEAGQEFERMEGTVLATGGAAGYTAGQLMEMADEIGQSTGNITGAMEAMQRLGETGRFAGNDLKLVGQIAADMSALTGESVQSAVAQLVRLQEDPVKAVAKLNDQFHFLTAAQFEEIEAAQQSGDSMKAASIAYEAMADKMQGRTDELNQHVNVLIRSWRDLRQVWTESMQEMDHALGGGDDAYGLTEAKQLLTLLKQQEAQAKETGSSALPGIRLEIQRQEQVVAELTAKFESTAKAAAQVGQAAQQSAQQIDAMAKNFKGGSNNASRDLEADLRRQEAEQQISYDRREAFEAEYWQRVLESSQAGSAEYIAAWQHVQSAEQQLDRQQEESWSRAQRQRAEAAREATREVIQNYEVERSESQAASAQRIAVDASLMERIAQMEGQQSADFKRALDQRLSDTRAYVNAYVAEQKRAQAEAENAYKSDAEAGIKSINDVFNQRSKDAEAQLRLHEITNNQEIALLQQYADEEFQVDRDILEHYRDLMAEKPEMVRKINSQIEQLEQKHAATMRQIDQKAAQQQYQTWTQYLNPINHAFNTMLNGMMQGTQNWQQVERRALSSILSSYIEMGAQMVKDWIARQVAKLTATTSTASEETTTLDAQRTTNAAADQTAATAAVTRASGVAGAQGVASFAGAPWPIDMGAPAFGASMAEAAAGFGSVASAAGGWDRVPFDDAPALLHRNEMVLPANLADRVRTMTGGDGGSGGGDNHFHINANDSKSFHQQLMRDPKMLAKAGKMAMRASRKR